MDNSEISPQHQAKQEYEAALYKAATRAANLIEAALQPDKRMYEPMEPDKLKLSISLLAIVQGVQPPDDSK